MCSVTGAAETGRVGWEDIGAQRIGNTHRDPPEVNHSTMSLPMGTHDARTWNTGEQWHRHPTYKWSRKCGNGCRHVKHTRNSQGVGARNAGAKHEQGMQRSRDEQGHNSGRELQCGGWECGSEGSSGAE